MRTNALLLIPVFLLILLCNKTTGQVKDYYITCDPEDFAYIYENFLDDIFIPITFTCGDTTWNDVKMRIRGDGSRYLPKKSLKVKFYSDPFSNGREELNFNAEYEDESYIRAYLSSQIFNRAGLTCFVTEHARLYLNGEFLGLYNRTENIDEQFLENHNMDPLGNLYKASLDGACLSIYDDLTNFWEQKTGSGNKEDLAQLIDAIHTASVDDYKSFCEEQMNYDQVVNIIACNMVTCNQSTYYHNYYMYHDVNGSGKWKMLPWDLDKTLSVYAWRNHTYSSAPWTHDNPYLEKAILNPEMLSDIKARANQILQDVFRTDIFWPKIDSLAAVLEASVAQDTTDNIQSVEDWLARVQVEKDHFVSFPAKLNWYFENVQSSFTCEPTPGYQPQDITFKWSTSSDPNGYPITYNFLLTTGDQFEPQLTQVFEGIQDTFFILTNIPEGDYFWKVISVGAGGQEVEAFDSKNPLKVRNLTTLPCSIDENMVLTAESSPYLVNCNVTVEPAATLTIEEGVILLFEAATHLKVEGGFQVNGSKQNPVYIEPVANNGTFDSIVFMQPQHDILINHLMMTDGVIHAQNANVTLNHCELILRNKALVYQNVAYGHYYGNGIFTNSRLIGNHTGQGLEYGWCESVIIENSHFTDIDDPMEFISVYSGYVKNNIAINSNDDGIDFNNCKNMAIEGNQLYNCSDNGVTIGNEFNGPCENILIKNNLIVNCSIGITVKDGSTAVSSRNTLFGNQTGIKLWEKNPGLGGGLLAVENTIISSTAGIVLDIDDISICNLVYTLCDSELLEGAGNLLDDPKFQSATSFNFQLQPDSPCIDAGNPGSQADSDGTVADMGAFFFNQGSFNIVFNEINYKSSSEFDTGDWIELYNPDSIPANISGWEFKDEDDNHVFNIPYGTVIQPGGYLVLCNNSQLFEQKHPDLDCFIGDFEFGLSTNGELLRLFNNTGELIDQVNYGAELPWPEEPNGQGPTLELKNPFLDNSLPESWCASSSYGTPGEVNSCTVYTVVNNDLFPITTAVFPNPATGRTNVKVNHLKEGELTIQVFNSKAEQILNTRTMLHGTGESMIEIKLPSEAGIYLVRYAFIGAADNYTGSVKLLVY